MVRVKSPELCYTANTNVIFLHASNHELEFLQVYTCITLVRKIQPLGQSAEEIVI
jgi:hypothetical protein